MDLRWSIADRPDAAEPERGRRTRHHRLMATTLIGLVATPTAAYAEGSWQSAISNARTNYESRRWTDNHSDNVHTTATVGGCSRDDGANFSLRVELRRARTALPDDSYGAKDVSGCTTQWISVDWGERTSTGTYFDRYLHYDFGTVSANPVKAAY